MAERRVSGVESLAKKIMGLAPIFFVIIEDNELSAQAMANPDISGREYQWGTLFGRELRECVLERDERRRVYRGRGNVPFELDHVAPKSKGGASNASNLVLACPRAIGKRAPRI